MKETRDKEDVHRVTTIIAFFCFILWRNRLRKAFRLGPLGNYCHVQTGKWNISVSESLQTLRRCRGSCYDPLTSD